MTRSVLGRLITTVLIALLLNTGVIATARAEDRKPNLIVIVAEDLGYCDLGCFGQKTLKTPRLDEMAGEGMRLTQFYTGGSLSGPSKCTLLTAKHTGRAIVRGHSSTPVFVPPDQLTVASLLKKDGYKTACIGSWGVGTPDNLTNPNDLGFEQFFGYVNRWHAHNPFPEFLIRNGKVVALKNEAGPAWKKWQDPKQLDGGKGVAVTKKEYAPDLLMDDALKFIRDNETKPFFLLVSLNRPHGNIEAGENGMEVPDHSAFDKHDWPLAEKAFAAMIHNLDRDTGKVLDFLKKLKIDKDTLVIFTSASGPHQDCGHKAEFFDSNGKFRGIKGDLNEGGIRMPTIAWWPGTVTAGSQNDLQWYLGDILATATELANVKPPIGLDSDSLIPALKGQSGEDKWKRRSPLYWESYEGDTSQAVRFGKWKAIRSPMVTGEIQLYDMSNDHSEKSDYSKRRLDLTRHATNLLNKHHQPDPNWKIPEQKKN